MENWHIEQWAAHIRTFISKDDFYQIKYYLDSWNLLKRKECVDQKVFGSSALIKACELERYDIIRYLVEECRADLETKSDAGLTPIHVACSNGDVHLIDYLISQGANIHRKNNDEQTYLMTFIENGALTRFLISKGIDIFERDICFKTAFDYALEKSALTSIEMLIKCGVDINVQPYAGEMAIAVACRTSNLGLLEYLVSNGGNINYVDDYGRTYLMTSVKDLKLCEVLIYTYWIDVNARDNFKKSALFYAVESNARSTLELLLKNDSDVFLKDQSLKSALHYAIDKRFFDIVDCLLACGADPNARDSIGYSVLQYAIDSRDIRILRRVLDYGADVNSVDDLGFETSVLHKAVVTISGENIVSLLLKYGAAINSRNFDLKTPLHLAVQQNSVSLSKFLLTHGADVNSVDINGRTPLHYAVQFCSSEMLSLLHKYGADLNAVDNLGMRPMLYAAALKKNSLLEDFLQHLSIFNITKIECYELMAANSLFQLKYEEAFDYLSTAISWREVNDLLLKPVTRVNTILNNVHEPNSFDELLSMRDDRESMFIQAAIIKARILGPYHDDVVEILNRIGQGLDEVDDIVLLQIKLHNLQSVFKKAVFDEDRAKQLVEALTEILLFVDSNQISFEDILPSLATVMHAYEEVVQLKPSYKSYSFRKFITCVSETLYISFTFDWDEKTTKTIKKYLRRFFEVCPVKDILNLLFDQFENDELPLCWDSCFNFVDMAIAFRFPLDMVDKDGSTPLHLLLSRPISELQDIGYEEIYDIIVKHGVHVCKTNRQGNSLLKLLKRTDYEICEVQDRTLQCLAAEVIRNNDIPFENVIPVHLIPFVKNHGKFKEEDV